MDKMTNKQAPLKTSTSLRYATPVGKHACTDMEKNRHHITQHRAN